MSIECVFCRGDKAIELKMDFPLCQTCVEMREFLMEWAATKEQHGLDPAEYGVTHLASRTRKPPQPCINAREGA